MTMTTLLTRSGTCLLLMSAIVWSAATETENNRIQILPAPGTVTVDGKAGDWDLSGGVFVCSDVEALRDRLGVWLHLMWDQDNLYVLSRWNDDTPMNNPGSIAGDMGFQGDCLQLRTIILDGEPLFAGNGQSEPPTQRTTHLMGWRDREGKDVIDVAWGMNFNQGKLKDAKTKGGAQAFLKNADGKGYVQEMSVPWSLLAPAGWTPGAGKTIRVTVEPNFGTDTKFRITTKDLFKAGITVDRVFTFSTSSCWGSGVLAAKGGVVPAPVRLADRREFPVRMQDGVPGVDWAGLYVEKKLAGFAPIAVELPEDGYVSLNIRNDQGQVVRQLLTANWFAKGKHEIAWDGLTNTSHLRPGEPVPAGAYTYDSIWHKGLGLRLVGWACNSGKAPFDSPGGNWGGDMGAPCAVTSTGDRMLLGWGASEAGQAVVCTDLDGNVIWRHKRGGFGGAALIAASDGLAFVYDAGQGKVLYRLSMAKGDYAPWPGKEDAAIDAGSVLEKARGAHLSGLEAAAGKLYLSYGDHSPFGQAQPSPDVVAVLDIASGKLLTTIAVSAPGDIEVGPDGAAYVVSAGKSVLRLDVAAGTATPVVSGLSGATGLALDQSGAIHVGLAEPDHQVRVFSADGKPLRTIGRKGGRPVLGAWDRSGMRVIAGLRVDRQGKLWVMENDFTPRRISVWNAADGAFVKEYFGPTSYGATGGAICPADPLVMFGHGSEWQLDPATGKAVCVAVVHRHGNETENSSRWGYGPTGRVYLAVGSEQYGYGTVWIYERLAAGSWKLRTTIAALDRKSGKGMMTWADANDDGIEQENEKHSFQIDLGGWINGWYMPFTQSMIFYGSNYRLAPVAWTACGAPVYDPTQSKRMSGPADAKQRGGMSARLGCGSEDGALMVYNGHYGADHSDFQCWDIERGRLAWAYPNNFVGVHGGHNAPPPAVGMIRGAYDVVGAVKLPAPIGNLFVIGTDKGEWHVINGDGFYISALFQSDPLKIHWPDPCVPGAVMDNTPPGMGGEDFGGSISATKDGQLYLQAGKTAFINLKVVGLDTLRTLGHGSITVGAEEVRLAAGFRERLVHGATATRTTTVTKRTVAFTGDVRADFADTKPTTWTKSGSVVETTIAYDQNHLYLGWSVANDPTPWINGATEPAVMYAKGDTVDFQLGTDPKGDPARAKPVLGDLRISIGDPRGKGPVAMLYRPVATRKQPRLFYSGTAKDGYEMQSVSEIAGARIFVKPDAVNRSYVVEAAIPLTAIELTPTPGLKLSGDFGVTYGSPAGDKTVLRSHWSNQAVDFVADEVWELMIEPSRWGTFTFAP